MSYKTSFFTNSFYQIIKLLDYMTQPEGTNIKILCKKLRLTRRSIFRLFYTIEHKLKIPVEVHRKKFGGAATYKITFSFVESLSNITLPAVGLSFNQALLLYLLLNEGVFSKAIQITKDNETLQEKLTAAFSSAKCSKSSNSFLS